MRLYTAVLACSLVSVGLFACSSDEKKPGPSDPFGTGGSGGSGGTSGTGGTSTGGVAGTAGEGGSGGTAGQDAGDAGGDAMPDVVNETGVESGPDAVPDIVIVIDTCPVAQVALGTSTLQAGGDTASAFAAAYNEELASATIDPFLMVFDGLDVDDPSAGSWNLRLGAAQDAGGGTLSFGETPATGTYLLGEQRAIALQTFDGEFSLRFGAVDIPIVSVKMGGQFDPDCGVMVIEDMTTLVPTTASNVAFHGSTLGALFGAPTGSYGGGQDNAWILSFSGVSAAVQFQ